MGNGNSTRLFGAPENPTITFVIHLLHILPVVAETPSLRFSLAVDHVSAERSDEIRRLCYSHTAA